MEYLRSPSLVSYLRGNHFLNERSKFKTIQLVYIHFKGKISLTQTHRKAIIKYRWAMLKKMLNFAYPSIRKDSRPPHPPWACFQIKNMRFSIATNFHKNISYFSWLSVYWEVTTNGIKALWLKENWPYFGKWIGSMLKNI